ncbi:MAG: 1-(5-phosphoribosyl)-5-[(5-phosphoribosylamino)methylideneamino]imidazole-4-carboxamide isomerase [Rikenellaceae bacterium]|nr:1-(5-phosphoribosyl)-5-[(5-phosphoribosylamino)methylideneamino]imidazole-4-carboxamide isomerase [Rikenellaceae bacterium]
MITIIPAIDMIGGECVRLTQGDYDRQTTYFKNPLEVAKRYEDIGVQRLHLVDLDGAKESHPAAVNLRVLERVAAKTALDIQYGGGIKSEQALKEVCNAGATRAICGSNAVKEPEAFSGWLRQFGPERVILGADIREEKIAIHGWLECSEMSVDDLIDRFLPDGLSQTICTDISKDGMLGGPNFGLYTRLQQKYDTVNVTVSGGISCIEDLYQLNELGLRSVVIGKAIYEGRITMEDLKKCLQNG